jgi:hypothetical protein
LEGNAAKKGNQGAPGPTHLLIDSISDKAKPARWLCRSAGRMERAGENSGRQNGLDWRYCARNKLFNSSIAQEEDRLTRVVEARRCNKKRRLVFPARALAPYINPAKTAGFFYAQSLYLSYGGKRLKASMREKSAQKPVTHFI